MKPDDPATPAHLFAVRAFRHAFFGTPPSAQAGTSRRPRPARPVIASDAQTIGSLDVAVDEEIGYSPLPSPTKGILLTPGTATARRKTVSFGDHVLDNEGKRPLKSGLPDDCPGKFPSPWTKSFDNRDLDETHEKPRGRNKLNEALEQARDESIKRRAKSSKQRKPKEDTDETIDLAEPQSEAGRYWKQEYDIYRERTTHEVRKLVEKNQLAKRYAREKDTECTELKEDVRREQRKAERLEKRVAELEAQLQELQNQSHSFRSDSPHSHEGFDPLRRDSATTGTGLPAARDFTKPIVEKPARPERRSWKHIATQQVQDRKLESMEPRPTVKDGDQQDSTMAPQGEALTPIKPRPRHDRTKSDGDSSVHLLAGSSISSHQTQRDAPLPHQPAVSAEEVVPLKPLEINTLMEQTHSIALSMGLQPPSPTQKRHQDRGERKPVLPVSACEASPKIQQRPVSPIKPPSTAETAGTISHSSPFHSNAVMERPNVLTGIPVPVQATVRPNSRRQDTKENDQTVAKSPPRIAEEQQKPSATWQAMDAPGRDGYTTGSAEPAVMPQDRLAAAKARLASRGRQVS